MADYTQPAAVEQRVRFFDGQFLQDQDFADEQKYHLDRERRLSKALRITGIVEGLTVTSAKANQVTVAPGTAIDSLGRQLVLSAELTGQQRSVDLPDAKFKDKQRINLFIVYQEDAVLPATTGIKGERRFQERPRLVAIAPDGSSSETTPWDNTPVVLLTQFNLGSGGTVQLVANTAQYAGLTLPGSLGVGTAPAFPLHVGAGKSVRLELGASQKLSLGGNGTLEVDAPGIAGGRFQVSENGNVGIGTTSPGAKIGFVNVDATTEAVGLTWHNPSPTDCAIHRTAGKWEAPNFQQLRLGWTTGIVIDPGTGYGKSYVDIQGNGLRVTAGNVGIGTTTPGARLEVKGGPTILEQEAWKDIPLMPGWGNYGVPWGPGQYFKDSNGVVHLRGLIKVINQAIWVNSIAAGNPHMFQLPSGYRPKYQQVFTTHAGDNNGLSRVDITSDGKLVAITGNVAPWVSLDSISFRAE